MLTAADPDTGAGAEIDGIDIEGVPPVPPDTDGAARVLCADSSVTLRLFQGLIAINTGLVRLKREHGPYASK
jgi:hypothetical protein